MKKESTLITLEGRKKMQDRFDRKKILEGRKCGRKKGQKKFRGKNVRWYRRQCRRRAGGGKNFKEEQKGGMMEGNAEVWKKGRVDKNKKKAVQKEEQME